MVNYLFLWLISQIEGTIGSTTKAYLQKISNPDHLKLSIIQKWKNKAKNLTWNSIRVCEKYYHVKPYQKPWYIKWYSLNSSRPVKTPTRYITYICQ